MKYLPILIYTGFLIASTASASFSATESLEMIPWSTEVHNDLIDSAFPDERADCIQKMKDGSLWVDSVPNQLPSKSYMHGMRSSGQTIDQARTLMATYIQNEYDEVAQDLSSSTQIVNSQSNDPLAQYTNDQKLITNMNVYLSACEHRGRGLHTVMDTTSPAHADFAIWSLIDFVGISHHGDFGPTIENEQVLIENPDLKTKTLGLMKFVQKVYIDLGMKEFRFE